MDKKYLIGIVSLIFLTLLIGTVSAGWFNDFFGKVTGQASASKAPIKACKDMGNYVFGKNADGTEYTTYDSCIDAKYKNDASCYGFPSKNMPKVKKTACAYGCSGKGKCATRAQTSLGIKKDILVPEYTWDYVNSDYGWENDDMGEKTFEFFGFQTDYKFVSKIYPNWIGDASVSVLQFDSKEERDNLMFVQIMNQVNITKQVFQNKYYYFVPMDNGLEGLILWTNSDKNIIVINLDTGNKEVVDEASELLVDAYMKKYPSNTPLSDTGVYLIEKNVLPFKYVSSDEGGQGIGEGFTFMAYRAFYNIGPISGNIKLFDVDVVRFDSSADAKTFFELDFLNSSSYPGLKKIVVADTDNVEYEVYSSGDRVMWYSNRFVVSVEVDEVNPSYKLVQAYLDKYPSDIL